MIQQFVDAWDRGGKEALRKVFSARHPSDYCDLVTETIKAITSDELYDAPDPKRIHEIGDGHYQGTLVYVIGASGYQPSTYWAVKISYGSCSGRDTLESIRGYKDEPPTQDQTQDYVGLCLNIVQELVEIP